MNEFFTATPVRVKNVSAGYTRAFLQQCYQDSLSGLLSLDSPNGSVIFLHVRGSVLSIFRRNKDAWDKVERGGWDDALTEAGGDLRTVEMPVDAVRLMRLFYLSPVDNHRSITVNASELPSIIEEVQKQNFGSLYYMAGDDNEAFVSVAGGGVPHVEMVFVTPLESRFESGVSLPEDLALGKQFKLFAVRCDYSIDVWQEYFLRAAFQQLMGGVLKRYKDIAGKSLTERLCQQVSAKAQGRFSGLTLLENGMIHRQIFESLKGAAEAYSLIYDQVGWQMDAIVGPKVMRDILLISWSVLRPQGRAILRQYVPTIQFGDVTAPLTEA
jgi:hypothetical protein